MEESFASDRFGRRPFDLIIVTNTSLSFRQIPGMIPDIKSRHPGVHIIVLSGLFTEDWVADIKRKGTDEFFALPYEEHALLRGVSGLLSTPKA